MDNKKIKNRILHNKAIFLGNKPGGDNKDIWIVHCDNCFYEVISRSSVIVPCRILETKIIDDEILIKYYRKLFRLKGEKKIKLLAIELTNNYLIKINPSRKINPKTKYMAKWLNRWGWTRRRMLYFNSPYKEHEKLWNKYGGV